jgi:DHA3 family macrolide efflux protein-like MFS transporter
MTKQIGWKQKFLTIAIGQTISLIGSSAVQFSLIWWLASETESPMVMALSGLFAFLPQLFLGPFAGVWVDRLKRKYVVIAADLFIGLMAIIIAIYYYLVGNPPYWTVCVILGIRAIGNVFHTPAIQAIVPMLVPKEELIKANGWSQFMQSGAFMLGPVFGAAMYAALPMWLILLTDFIGAVVASICVAVVKIPEVKKSQTEIPRFLAEMKEGALVFLKDKKIFAVTLITTGCMIFYLPLSSYYPLMASSYFKVSPLYGSMVELLFAGGMMGSALVMSMFGNIKHKFLIIHLGLLGIGVTSFISGILPSSLLGFWIFAAACAAMGASGNIFNIPYMAYLQETIPPEALGRVFSLTGSLMSLAMPLGLLISGPFAEKHGVPFWFFITGVAIMFFVIVDAIYLIYLKSRVLSS